MIEKVIYESLPGYYVTANLYRPNQPGRYPGVLLQAGHTQEGKAEPQLLAANLALKGFVSLAFDPVGQGEREQIYDAQLKGPAAGRSVNEHIHAGAQSSLIGEGVGRYFVWDAKRSIDYLASRPEVDATRLGAAGCSGGGALTTFIGALDSRLKAIIPACFPESYQLVFGQRSTFGRLCPVIFPVDWIRRISWSYPARHRGCCRRLRKITSHLPEPGLFTRRRGAGTGCMEQRRRSSCSSVPVLDGTPVVSREAVYRWSIRWLKNGEGDFHEARVKIYTNYELLVTKTGRVEDEGEAQAL